jgi:post-segregation antitoxin (ccd killing protein)
MGARFGRTPLVAVTVTLPADLVEDIHADILKTEFDLNVSQWVRRACKRDLRRVKKNSPPAPATDGTAGV